MIYEGIYAICKPFPLEKRIKRFDMFCENAFIGHKTLVHRANDQLWAMPMILPVESLRSFVYVPFEDTEFMISKDYHTILTQLYGSTYIKPKKVSDKAQEVHDITRENG